MRFNLPAYLIADMNGDYNFGVDYTLTNSFSNFATVSAKQHNAVRAYLILITEEATSCSEEKILRALREYWTEQSE